MIDASSDDVAAHYNRGLAYVKLSNKDGWQEDFAQVLELDASHTGAQNALCWAYVLEQEAEAALSYCERAVILDPTGLSRDSRGIAYAQVGRTGEAIADFEAYLAWLASQPAEVRERYGPVRRGWIDALRAGRNPFHAAALAALRNE